MNGMNRVTGKPLAGLDHLLQSKIGYLFEDAQVQAGLRPLIQNMEEYRKIREEAMGAGGTVDADFAERMRDASEQTKACNTGAKRLST